MTFNPNVKVYVSPDGLDTAAGGMLTPVATIAEAISRTPSVVHLLPGTYRENVTIHDHGANSLLIQGYACHDSSPVEWLPQSGNTDPVLTISGSSTRIRLRDLQLDGDGQCICVYDNGSTGRHYFDNVTFNNSGILPVIHRAAGQRWFECSFCCVDGNVLLDGTPQNDASFGIKMGVNSHNCTLDVNSGYTAKVDFIERMGHVQLNGGTFVGAFVASWQPDGSDVIITCAAGTTAADVVQALMCVFTADGVTFGSIDNKGAATVVEHGNKTA